MISRRPAAADPDAAVDPGAGLEADAAVDVGATAEAGAVVEAGAGPGPAPRPRKRLRTADLFREAVASVRISPFGSLLVSLGTVLATAALVATAGISATLSHQVSSEFDAVRATEVHITVAPGAEPTTWTEDGDLARARSLPGVVGLGVMRPPATFAARRPVGGTIGEVKVRPVDAAIVRILRPRMVAGRAFDGYHVASHSPVVMLSRSVATRLAVARPGAVVELAGQPLTVIGIYDHVERWPETLLEALVPLGVATGEDPDEAAPEILIETAPGAASVVAQAAAATLHPEDPAALVPSSPLDASNFRRGVEAPVARLSLGVVLICLMLGTVSIASAATASVYARTGEIGLRCVLGARPRHIFAQLMTETLVLGVAGGLAGSALGLTAVIATCTWNGWMPVLDVDFVLAALAAGAGSGLVAGLLPARRAMRLQPVDALRR